jgi:hypothetical protein
MRAEAVSAFVVIVCSLIIVKHPARMLGSARPVHQEAEFIIFTFPEPADAAMIAMLFPEGDVDMTFRIERRDKFITVPRRALGKLLGAREIESDAFESVRQGGHGLVSLISMMLTIMPRSGKAILIWISLPNMAQCDYGPGMKGTAG